MVSPSPRLPSRLIPARSPGVGRGAGRAPLSWTRTSARPNRSKSDHIRTATLSISRLGYHQSLEFTIVPASSLAVGNTAGGKKNEHQPKQDKSNKRER